MSDTEVYAPEEPRSFDATIERQPYEPAKETADSINAHEAADLVNQTRGEQNEIIKRHVRDPEDVNRVAPADVTWTAETAADALKSAREFEHNLEQESLDVQLAAEVDKFRGAPQEQQPEPPPQPDWAPEVQPETAAPEPSELDHLLEALPADRRAPFVAAYNQHLQQAQAQAEAQYNQYIAQAQNYAQQYEQGVAQTLLVSEAAAAAPFPELASAPPEQRQAILAHIARTDPARYQAIRAHISQVKEVAGNQIAEAQRIHQYQENQKQQQQEQAKAQFRQYADFHDSRVPAVSNLPEVQREIMAMAQEHGIGQQELMELYEKSPVVRHSAFQAMMLDAAKYRLAQKATRAAQVRTVPQVQKPGTRNDDAVRESEYNNIEREFRGKNLSPKEAAKLVIARRARQ